MKVQLSSMNLAVATVGSTLICRDRAAGEESPTVVPSLADPLRGIAPVTQSRLSSSEVLPLRYGPTSAAQRGPDGGFWGMNPPGFGALEPNFFFVVSLRRPALGKGFRCDSGLTGEAEAVLAKTGEAAKPLICFP